MLNCFCHCLRKSIPQHKQQYQPDRQPQRRRAAETTGRQPKQPRRVYAGIKSVKPPQHRHPQPCRSSLPPQLRRCQHCQRQHHNSKPDAPQPRRQLRPCRRQPDTARRLYQTSRRASQKFRTSGKTPLRRAAPYFRAVRKQPAQRLRFQHRRKRRRQQNRKQPGQPAAPEYFFQRTEQSKIHISERFRPQRQNHRRRSRRQPRVIIQRAEICPPVSDAQQCQSQRCPRRIPAENPPPFRPLPQLPCQPQEQAENSRHQIQQQPVGKQSAPCCPCRWHCPGYDRHFSNRPRRLTPPDTFSRRCLRCPCRWHHFPCCLCRWHRCHCHNRPQHLAVIKRRAERNLLQRQLRIPPGAVRNAAARNSSLCRAVSRIFSAARPCVKCAAPLFSRLFSRPFSCPHVKCNAGIAVAKLVTGIDKIRPGRVFRHCRHIAHPARQGKRRRQRSLFPVINQLLRPRVPALCRRQMRKPLRNVVVMYGIFRFVRSPERQPVMCRRRLTGSVRRAEFEMQIPGNMHRLPRIRPRKLQRKTDMPGKHAPGHPALFHAVRQRRIHAERFDVAAAHIARAAGTAHIARAADTARAAGTAHIARTTDTARGAATAAAVLAQHKSRPVFRIKQIAADIHPVRHIDFRHAADDFLIARTRRIQQQPRLNAAAGFHRLFARTVAV